MKKILPPTTSASAAAATFDERSEGSATQDSAASPSRGNRGAVFHPPSDQLRPRAASSGESAAVETTSTPPRRRLAPLDQDALTRINLVNEKKVDIQEVGRVFAHATQDKDKEGHVHSVLQQANITRIADDASVSNSFSTGQPALIRTLRLNNDDEATKGFGASGKTPAKREVDTLANRITGRDIVMTPATVILADAKVNTISTMVVPDRPKWKGLPSVVSLPLQQAAEPARHGWPEVVQRPGFGDIHSFASNKGFDEEYVRTSPGLSHSEKLQMLEGKVTNYIKSDPGRKSLEFSHSLEELGNNLGALQSVKQPEALRHNEFCTKLELWDARALEVGSSRPVAIATMLEFNIEMAAMAREMENDGPSGKLLNNFMERQLSWTESGGVKSLASSLADLNSVSPEDRKQILDDICSSLRKGISLCTYEHQGGGSSIRAMSSGDFKADEVLAGLKLFLSSKLQHLP